MDHQPMDLLKEEKCSGCSGCWMLVVVVLLAWGELLTRLGPRKEKSASHEFLPECHTRIYFSH